MKRERPVEGTGAIPVVAASSLSPRQFFEQFVALRKPCLLEGLVEGALPEELRSDPTAALTRRAGQVLVEVERPPYGSGNKIRLPLREFIDSGMQTYYMTTQRKQQSVISEPLTPFQLSCPELAGHLTLANLNCWLGGAKASSTPLHVDYHDNFYMLLRGAKTFRLFAPSEATHLQTHGKVARVHSNGLVNFVGGETNADGSTPVAIARRILEDDERFTNEQVEEALETLLEHGDEGGDDEYNSGEKGADEEEDGREPPHFCKITADAAVKAGCTEASVDISAGQCLYLPAGYFHQVESRVVADESYHFAVNFWFFPPDTGVFDKPYSTVAWEK